MRQMWEYSTLKVSQLPLTDADVKKALTDAGNDGWELVAVTYEGAVTGPPYYSLVFKRPK